MKRNVLFVLLLIGVGSVLAIAVSIPEPIRMLSDAEKDEIIGGCGYDCPDCKKADYYCGEVENCKEGRTCDDPGKVNPVNPRCVSGGPHPGLCGDEELYACYQEMWCMCELAQPSGYKCTEGEWSDDEYRWHILHPCSNP